MEAVKKELGARTLISALRFHSKIKCVLPHRTAA